MSVLPIVPTTESPWDDLENLCPKIESSIAGLIRFLQSHDFEGNDPYDGLGSSVFQRLPLRNNKWARLAITHLNKRSPVNLRWVLGVPKGRNPKGIALCASAFLELRDKRDEVCYGDEARGLLSWLLENQSHGFSGMSWGYNFDWQSRAFFAPRGTPNAVCTVFAANALLDAFDVFQEAEYIAHARACCEFLVEHLLVKCGNEIHFRYIPTFDTEIHNVNLLAAALLARVAAHTHEHHLLDLARQSIGFTVARQRLDGSWPYGEASNQSWIDNYHTGFNLIALLRYRRYTEDKRFSDATQRAYEFWSQKFWRADGAPKFCPDREYPVDIHCIAQTVLTYLEFGAADAGEKIATTLRWAWQNMWSSSGYFYFQRNRLYTIRTPYARWAQAWMLYALSRLWRTVSCEAEIRF